MTEASQKPGRVKGGLQKTLPVKQHHLQCTFWDRDCYEVISVWPRPVEEQKTDVKSLLRFVLCGHVQR